VTHTEDNPNVSFRFTCVEVTRPLFTCMPLTDNRLEMFAALFFCGARLAPSTEHPVFDTVTGRRVATSPRIRREDRPARIRKSKLREADLGGHSG